MHSRAARIAVAATRVLYPQMEGTMQVAVCGLRQDCPRWFLPPPALHLACIWPWSGCAKPVPFFHPRHQRSHPVHITWTTVQVCNVDRIPPSTYIQSSLSIKMSRNPKHDNVPDGYMFFCCTRAAYWHARENESLANSGYSFELFLLQDGEKKITETPFPRTWTGMRYRNLGEAY